MVLLDLLVLKDYLLTRCTSTHFVHSACLQLVNSMRRKSFTFIKMGHPNLTIGASLKIFQAVGRAIKKF
jgi:hypothetical protein